jgi:hypothetical protein
MMSHSGSRAALALVAAILVAAPVNRSNAESGTILAKTAKKETVLRTSQPDKGVVPETQFRLQSQMSDEQRATSLIQNVAKKASTACPNCIR